MSEEPYINNDESESQGDEGIKEQIERMRAN